MAATRFASSLKFFGLRPSNYEVSIGSAPRLSSTKAGKIYLALNLAVNSGAALCESNVEEPNVRWKFYIFSFCRQLLRLAVRQAAEVLISLERSPCFFGMLWKVS